jgi:tRNA(Ile2) C34 agmatinyltransferase TiaS
MSGNLLTKQISRFSRLMVSEQPVCPACGSTKIIERGFAGSNRRHSCRDCGFTAYIDQY